MTTTTDQKALPPEYECRKAFFDWLSTKNTNDLIGYEAMFSVWQAAWNTRSQPLAGLPTAEAITEAIVNANLGDVFLYKYTDWIAEERKGGKGAKGWLDARRAEAKAVLDLLRTHKPALGEERKAGLAKVSDALAYAENLCFSIRTLESARYADCQGDAVQEAITAAQAVLKELCGEG